MTRSGMILCCILGWRLASQAQIPLSVNDEHGQAPLSITYTKSRQVPVTGATAAYSLDSRIAEATASNGVVEITGKSPGKTSIVVVTTAGVQTISVVIPQPPPIYPPGFVPPNGEKAASESGSYDVRYLSNPAQLTNSIEFRRSEGDSFKRIQVVNSNLFSTTSTPTIGFPLASYEISRPAYDVVFVDQNVSNSPLTLESQTVRGFHLRRGEWFLHGGFSSIATFQGLFLSTDPEYLGGVSRRFQFRPSHSLLASAYYFANQNSDQRFANGGVGSLTYLYKPKKQAARFLTELAAGKGVALVSQGFYDGTETHLAGSFRIVPKRFASLAINNQHGTFAEVNANRKINTRLSGIFALSKFNFNLPSFQQDTLTASSSLNYKLNRNFSVSSGFVYSKFGASFPPTATLQSWNVPLGVDFSSQHWGGGFQYQHATNSDGSGGNDYGVNLRTSVQQFQFSAYFRHDVQVPSVAVIVSQVPGLQDALSRLGIVATSPDQIAQLLGNTALLATLGFTSPFAVSLAPSRNDTGASIGWSGRGTTRQRADLNFYNSNLRTVTGSTLLTTWTASYTRQVSSRNDMVATFSTFRTKTGTLSEIHPLVGVSLQHRFSTVPGFLLPGRRGVITGHVFHDDESSGQYGKQAPLAGVEVALDGERVTHSDRKGEFSFHQVPYGEHKVEARFHSEEPFFFTTDSPALAQINSVVDFGISFAKGRIFGFLKNDAGAGISDVMIKLTGAKAARTMRTLTDGKFSFDALESGEYTLSTLPESYPPGYSLQQLRTEKVTVVPGAPQQISFTARALRAVSGKVVRYDLTSQSNVPVAGVLVKINELSLEASTGSDGAYIIRNLPAGNYTVVAAHEGKEVSRILVLSSSPENVHDLDLVLPPK